MMTKPHEVPFRVHDSDNNNGVRRMSKPMMEKRRRARINNSLMQLKAIVVDSGKLNIQNPKCKLEKADILELTVKYVQKLITNRLDEQQQQENSQTMHYEFVAGFAECAKQVEEFVCQNSTQPIDPKIVTSLNSHLNNCLNTLETQEVVNHGVIRHTGQCCPPSPAPSSMSSASGHQMIDMDMSSSTDEDMPLNLVTSSRLRYQFQMDDCVWRPW